MQYHASLANALAKHLPVTIIAAQVTPVSLFDPTIQRYSLNTGQNAAGTFFNLFSSAWKRDLEKALSQSRPDLVHIVAPHEWNPFVQRLIHKMGFPLAYSIHDPIAHPGTPLYFRIMETLSRIQPDAWFGLSKKAILQLVQQGYKKINCIMHLSVHMPFPSMNSKQLNLEYLRRMLFSRIPRRQFSQIAEFG